MNGPIGGGVAERDEWRLTRPGTGETRRPRAGRMVAEVTGRVARPVDIDQIEERARTRAEPLPEERAVQADGEDRQGEAAEILRDSEERVSEATTAPADAAREHRRSEETA